MPEFKQPLPLFEITIKLRVGADDLDAAHAVAGQLKVVHVHEATETVLAARNITVVPR